MATQSYVSTVAVAGMNCGHCVSSVTEELAALPGVTRVDVDLAAGNARVVAERELSNDEVERAISSAGYRLVGAQNREKSPVRHG